MAISLAALLLLSAVASQNGPGYERLADYFGEDHWRRDDRTEKKLSPLIKIGASSSAFKIEGSWNEDGKTESIWDRWVNERQNETFENHHIACDSYHSPELDVEALKELGAQTYRFSVAWSRIIDEDGVTITAGVEYYQHLVKMLMEANIEPVVTLFDWDLPSSLQDNFDGFLRHRVYSNDKVIAEFVAYAEVVFKSLPDVATYVTINEPYAYCVLGHLGQLPPGLDQPEDGALLCGHNMLRAHASVAKVFHEKYAGRKGRIGINLEASWSEPLIWAETEHVEAAWRAQQFKLGWFLRPLIHGEYPPIVTQYVNENRKSMDSDVSMPRFNDEEIKSLIGSADFIGLNYKTSLIARHNDDYNATESIGAIIGDSRVIELPDWRNQVDQTGRPQAPYGLRRLLEYVKAEYGSLRLTIGLSSAFTGMYNDAQKVAYLDAHLNQLTRVVDDHNIDHIFVQSLTDGFERNNEYEFKYGLFHVDFYDNERPRSIKRSGKWLKHFIASRTFINDVKDIKYARFEPSFKFGAMTAAYQHESGIDGSRDFAVWDIQGIRGPHRSADILTHFDDDVSLLKKLKLKTYGLSLSWGRVFRYTDYSEDAEPDMDVLDMYRVYITKLVDAGIEPVVALYNWDMPRIVLREYDGWRSPSRPRDWSGRKAFVHYAKACFEALGDVVPYWVTFQEPQRELMLAYEANAAPPEFPVNLPGRQVYENAKNMLMAHAEAKAAFDKMGFKNAKFGVTLGTDIGMPFDAANQADVDAAARYNAFSIDWLLTPLIDGDWPEVMKETVGERLGAFSQDEQDLLRGSIDFIGAMHKTHHLITYRETQQDIVPQSFDKDRNVDIVVNFDSRQTSATYQRITKSGAPVQATLNYLSTKFNGDIIFMSGVASRSSALDEQPDKRRNNRADTAMTTDHQMQVATHAILNSVLKSVIDDGVNVIGYMHWALLDGYEFVTQHSEAWGLVAVDWTKPQRKRQIKQFGYWYSDVVEARGFQNREMACNPIPEQLEIKSVKFSDNFIWATATAATQIEGAANEGGKGRTIWDEFAEVEGNVLNGDTPAVACDSYHQFERDIEMIKELGTNSYRFSISWARIYPTGRASDGVNKIGLAWYVTFVTRLINEGIRPLVTLYHWDLPNDLETTVSGWMDESGTLVDEYVNYADIIFAALSEAGVRDWITFNEPYVFCFLGYSNGDHAPGLDANYLQCGHNMINAHTRAYRLFKQKYQDNYPDARVGVTLNVNYVMSYEPQDPESQIPTDIQFEFALKWLSDPIFGTTGDYSQEVKSIFGNLTKTDRFDHWVLPEFTPEEKLANVGASDFFGLNFYNGNLMFAATPLPALNTYLEMTNRGRIPDWMNCDEWWTGASHWLHHTPDHYRFMIRQLDRWYPGVTILGTENGVSGAPSWLDPAVTMDDWWRKRQIVEYIGQAGRAIVEDGINYVGYSEWSLMDNFEWGSGYTESFGLFRVDFTDKNRTRIPKDSVKCFNRIVSANEVRTDYEQCDWESFEIIDDELDHPELDYINRTSKIDYWERDQVYYGSYNKTAFGFGAATASYQIEGAWDEDGKGVNIWDHFSNFEQPQTPDDEGQCLVARCETGNIACDSYHNVERDVAYAKALNLDQYRFSINWARILPTGELNSGPNQPGVDYYNNLIDGLIAVGIEPMITLFHWDLPYDLQEAYGGFNSSLIVDDFNAYANLCFGLFGDRVTKWMTFNEPHSYCWQGHDVGGFPPRFGDATGANFYRCAHNMILSHAKAYRTYKERHDRPGGEISITINGFWGEPRDPTSDADILAAQRYMVHQIAHWVDPLYYGDYPVEMKNQLNKLARKEHFPVSRLPEFTEDEKVMLKGALDFYSLQMYSTRLVTTQPDYTDPMRLCLDHYTRQKCQELLDDPLIEPDRLEELLYWFRPGWYGDMEIWTAIDPEWEKAESIWLRNTPWGLRRMINWIDQRYPDVGGIWITENGISLEESIADPDRYQYIYLHFNEMLKAIEIDGVNVRGTCIWSLMDNFEWVAGYNDNFGVYHVEFNAKDGLPAGSDLPDTWDKTSVPRIADLIKNPVYKKPVDKPIGGKFEDDFVFGVSTRGIEVESNVEYGNSVWDDHVIQVAGLFDRVNLWQPASTAASAQEFVNEDVEIMKQLGMKSYSFSISWSKLIQSDGQMNADYHLYITQLCKALKENSIESVATIFSYDLPKELKLGWRTDAVMQKVVNEKYIELLIEQFGSLVDRWITFDKIQTEVILGQTDPSYPLPDLLVGTTSQIEKSFKNVVEMNSYVYEKFAESKLTSEVGIVIEAFQYATPANVDSSIDVEFTKRHNQINIGNLLEDLRTTDKFDFVTFDYETTGLVTKLDHLYNSTIHEFDDNFDNHRASQYSNDWTGQQGGKQGQRFIKNGLRQFLNEYASQIKKNVFVKTRWTTTATAELYPIFTERDLLLGKNKRVDDSHRQRVTKEWLGDIMKCQKLDGLTNIRGVYFDYIDSWGTPSASHFTNGLVEVELNKSLKRSTRVVKPSAGYIADVIENGLAEDPSEETTTTTSTTTTTTAAGDKEPVEEDDNKGLIIGLSVAGSLLVIVIIGVVVMKRRKKKKSHQVDNEFDEITTTDKHEN